MKLSREGNRTIYEEKRRILRELEELITTKATDYYYRKGPLFLVVLPKGKTIMDHESAFHLEVKSDLIVCHLQESFKSDHFELLKEKGYLKRKNGLIKFETVFDFSHFLDEIIIK